jgi:hypothetical protein
MSTRAISFPCSSVTAIEIPSQPSCKFRRNHGRICYGFIGKGGKTIQSRPDIGSRCACGNRIVPPVEFFIRRSNAPAAGVARPRVWQQAARPNGSVTRLRDRIGTVRKRAALARQWHRQISLLLRSSAAAGGGMLRGGRSATSRCVHATASGRAGFGMHPPPSVRAAPYLLAPLEAVMEAGHRVRMSCVGLARRNLAIRSFVRIDDHKPRQLCDQ